MSANHTRCAISLVLQFPILTEQIIVRGECLVGPVVEPYWQVDGVLQWVQQMREGVTDDLQMVPAMIDRHQDDGDDHQQDHAQGDRWTAEE